MSRLSIYYGQIRVVEPTLTPGDFPAVVVVDGSGSSREPRPLLGAACTILREEEPEIIP